MQRTPTFIRCASLAALALMGATTAQAQSSVTVYGIVDVFVQYGRGDSTQTAIQSGGVSSSRLGFRGTEDLGGGLKVNFQLESGLLADTGAQANSSSFFARQSWVGLSSTSWGSVSAGRQTIPQYDILDSFDTFGTGAGSSASSNIVSTTSRASNSLKYRSPTVGGFSATALVGLGETVPNSTSVPTTSRDNGNVYSLGGTYQSGAWRAGAAVNVFNRSNDALENARYLLLTAEYDFGPAKVSGAWQQVRNLAGSAVADRTEAMLGVTVPVSEHNTVKAAVGLVNGQNDAQDARQITLGFTHLLSKRTSLYAVASHIDNGEATSYTTTAATGTGPSTSAGQNVRSLQLGVRHAF